jgi:hypothetical protein
MTAGIRCAFLLPLAAMALAAPAGLTLIEKGRSPYTIVVAQDASPSERRGAQELQRFLEEMSGARLPIVTDQARSRGPWILVGRSRALDRLGVRANWDALGPEGFLLRTAGRNLIIAGGRQRGTMYGVYAFLEKLGCRWFTAEVSRIPKLPTVRVPALDEIQSRPSSTASRSSPRPSTRTGRRATGSTGISQARRSHGRQDPVLPVRALLSTVASPGAILLRASRVLLADRRQAPRRARPAVPDQPRRAASGYRDGAALDPPSIPRPPSSRSRRTTGPAGASATTAGASKKRRAACTPAPCCASSTPWRPRVEKRHPDKLIDTLAYWYTEAPPARVRPRPNVRVRLCPDLGPARPILTSAATATRIS